LQGSCLAEAVKSLQQRQDSQEEAHQAMSQKLQVLSDYLEEQVQRISQMGGKGQLPSLEAYMLHATQKKQQQAHPIASMLLLTVKSLQNMLRQPQIFANRTLHVQYA